jgi:hypothetical protein
LLDQACAHCPIFPTAASRRSLGRVSVPVWLIVLSDQLPIAGLVGLYPTNYLIGRRPLPRRLTALSLSSHAVLAPVSQGCPPPQDTFLRDTHPSAADGRNHPRDLHVLSMPPAFALSQDQTLRFIMPSQAKAQPCRCLTDQAPLTTLDAKRSSDPHHTSTTPRGTEPAGKARTLASKRPMQFSKIRTSKASFSSAKRRSKEAQKNFPHFCGTKNICPKAQPLRLDPSP